MPRARGRVPAHARHRKVIKAAKGFYGRRKNTFRTAQAAVVKAGVNAYKGRKQKKRSEHPFHNPPPQCFSYTVAYGLGKWI